MGRNNRRNESQQRAAGRVRGRVQQRTRGGAKRGGRDSGRKTMDLDAIEGYAKRLASRSGGTSNLSGAASDLAKAAPGLAGGSFASRLFAGDAPMSDENFRKEVAEHFALLEERLQRLEEQVSGEPGAVEENIPESSP